MILKTLSIVYGSNSYETWCCWVGLKRGLLYKQIMFAIALFARTFWIWSFCTYRRATTRNKQNLRKGREAQIPSCECLLSIRASLDTKRKEGSTCFTYIDSISLPSGCRSLQDLDPLLSFFGSLHANLLCLVTTKIPSFDVGYDLLV